MSKSYYEVPAPIADAAPESITVDVDGRTIRFEGYVGRRRKSRIFPDVLLYEQRVVEDGGGGS